MSIKQLFLITLLLSTSLIVKSQQITRSSFRISDYKKGISSVELIIDNQVIVGLDESGNVAYADYYYGRDRVFNPNDDGSGQPGNPSSPYDFDYDTDYSIDYYNKYSNNSERGKLKSIGNLSFKYYTEFDMHDPIGKLKSIGNIQIKYNNRFDIHDEFGTLKSIGNIKIDYYNVFDMNDPKGKVKSIGNVKIQYFNKFDEDKLFGRIKSIRGNSKSLFVSRQQEQYKPGQ